MDISINDLATLLIQTDADNVSELSRLKEMLSALVQEASYSESCREKMVQALKKIEDMVESKVADPEHELMEVGKIVEDVMNDMEESIKIPSRHSELPDSPSHETIRMEQTSDDDRTDSKDEKSEVQYLPEDSDRDLISGFITESMELISNAEEALLLLETDPDNMDAVAVVFRAFHTIKGTSAFLKLTLVSEMAHQAETFLSRVRNREIRYTGGYADLALRSIDMLKILIQITQDVVSDSGKPFVKPDGYDELLQQLSDPEKAGITEVAADPPPFKPRIGDILVAQGKIEREKIEEAAAQKDEKLLGEKIVQSKAATLMDVAQGLRTQQRLDTRQKTAESTVRVPVERLDRFIDMVGELVIAHSMVARDEVITTGNHYELNKKVSQTEKIVRELQRMSMSMRMIPLKGMFQKMARLARDLSRTIGKKLNFITEGEDTEIDRNMVDIISDPLVHMIRNAIDHGIEPPDVREKAGKSPTGTVQLSAYHSAGNVVVEITDDGKGIDREAVIAKAIQVRLIREDQEKTLTDREVYNLIFEPGFSTSQIVSEVSGRGVGMDVVRRNIETLHGQIDIQTAPGKGSTFKMSFPLTLAIIDGMVVRVNDQIYVLPTASIVRSVQPAAQDIVRVLRRGEMLRLQGKLMPLFRLGRLFEVDGAEQDPTRAIAVIVEDEGRQAAILIDELVGSQQIVIKSLGEALGSISGISGGAIMPNGRVGLILDVPGLMRLAHESDDR